MRSAMMNEPLEEDSIDIGDDVRMPGSGPVFAHVDDMPGEAQRLSAEALLVRALVHEVQTGALVTTGAASAVNAIDKPIAGIALAEARAAVIDFPARLDHWPQRILDEQLGPDTLEAVATFYAAFQGARSKLLTLEREAREIGLGRALSVHNRSVVTSWRMGARHAEVAIAALTHDCGHMLPDTSIANTSLLTSLLQRTSQGGRPCLAADGRMRLPRLPERRRAPRRSMLQTASVRCGNSQFIAFVLDASPGGIGMSRMPDVQVGDRLTVELQSGRILTGAVAWVRDGEAGIRLDRDLMPTDPLLFG